MEALSPFHLMIILAVIVLFFEGRKIPDVMRGVGEGIRNFKEHRADCLGIEPALWRSQLHVLARYPGRASSITRIVQNLKTRMAHKPRTMSEVYSHLHEELKCASRRQNAWLRLRCCS
jgi:TatA/E family protein of Tat protein translocase